MGTTYDDDAWNSYIVELSSQRALPVDAFMEFLAAYSRVEQMAASSCCR